MISIMIASAISIEPKEVSFNMMSGQNITKNVTLKSDGNFVVFLNHTFTGNKSNMDGFYVNYTSPVMLLKELTIPITYYSVPNFKPDNFTINFEASYLVEQVIVSSDGGGSHHTVYKNVTQNVTQYVTLNCSDEDEIVNDTTNDTIEPVGLKKRLSDKDINIIIAAGFALICLFVVILILRMRSAINDDDLKEHYNEDWTKLIDEDELSSIRKEGKKDD